MGIGRRWFQPFPDHPTGAQCRRDRWHETAGDYARDCQVYIDSLDIIVPNANFTLVGGNRGDTERAAHWNDSLYTFVDSESFDALAWHVYLYMKDEHAGFSNRKFLCYPYYDIPRIEEWRGFQDTISQIQNHKINVTEYNLFDKSTENIYRNTWLHALFLSAMTDNILDNNLVHMVLAHNVGGPTGFDAISNDQSINCDGKRRGLSRRTSAQYASLSQYHYQAEQLPLKTAQMLEAYRIALVPFHHNGAGL